MPAIPEFVLRKLYIPGSLKAWEGGFELQLNNTLAPVTLTGLGITADEQPCALQDILLSLLSADERTADSITSRQPFDLASQLVPGRDVLPAGSENDHLRIIPTKQFQSVFPHPVHPCKIAPSQSH